MSIRKIRPAFKSPYFAMWNEVIFSGIVTNETIKSDLWELERFLVQIADEGYFLVAMNDQGLILDILEDDSPDDRFREFNEKINHLSGMCQNHNTDIFKLFNQIEILKGKSSSEEVTQEFYIFYDMLPADIKKEIKIYVNK